MSGNRPTVLITGATDGLGLALARRYATQGARLILVGHRPMAGLDPALFTPATYCQSDLRLPAVGDMVAQFLHRHGVHRIDLLIHNAGSGYYGTFEQQPAAAVSELVAVNVRAPITLTHRLLPYILRAHGHIVVVSSVAAVLPAPDYAIYAATKAALEGFARSLRSELGSQATVQVVAPGAMRTGMHARSGADPAALGWAHFPPADVVAGRMIRQIARRRRGAGLGSSARLLRFAGLYLPGLVDRIVARRR